MLKISDSVSESAEIINCPVRFCTDILMSLSECTHDPSGSVRTSTGHA